MDTDPAILPPNTESVIVHDVVKDVVNVTDNDRADDENEDVYDKMGRNKLYKELNNIRHSNEILMVNLNYCSILVPALVKKVELTRTEEIKLKIKDKKKYQKTLRNYFTSGTIIKGDIHRRLLFKAINAQGNPRKSIIKRKANNHCEHRTWSCAANIKPQNSEPEVQIISEEEQPRDNDSIKSINSDLDRDFTIWELDMGDTPSSLDNCSLLPLECTDVIRDTCQEAELRYRNQEYQDDILATAIMQSKNIFVDQTEYNHPSTEIVNNCNEKKTTDMIDPKEMSDTPEMTPIEELANATQGTTHAHFFIDPIVPLTEEKGEKCKPVETAQQRPLVI